MTHTETTPSCPADVFLHLVVTFLTPMFLAATGGDISRARTAATSTVNAYNARHPTDLLPIAQIIAFGLATLDSLNRSMNETLSTSLVLRLRGNAASLSRAADQCRRSQHATPPEATSLIDHEAERQREAALIAGLARTEQRLAEVGAIETPTAPRQTARPPAAPTPTATIAASTTPAPPSQSTQAAPPVSDRTASQASTTQDAIRTAWATAMTGVARDFTANLAGLPLAERHTATMRATALSSVANHLLSNAPLPPSPLDPPSRRGA